MKTQKTKKSFKKKALLSSLSMLMVATVAVGSATFAWFTQNPTADAQGLVMRATASNGLKVLTESHKKTADHENDEYVSHDFLDCVFDEEGTPSTSGKKIYLNPASYAITADATLPTPYTTLGTTDADGTAKTGETVKAATAARTGTYDIYAEKIYCKLVGTAKDDDTSNINIASLVFNTNSALEISQSARIVLTYYDSNAETPAEKVLGVYAPTAAVGEGKSCFTSAGLVGSTATTGTYTTEAVTAASKTNIGQVGTTGNDYVGVYVYLDGEDGTCKSANIKASDIISKVQVNLSIPTNS